MLGNDGIVRSKRRSHVWNIVYEDGHDYWINSDAPCYADLNTINSFCNNIFGILGGVLFVKAFLQYYGIEPEPNSSVTTYFDNTSAI